MRKSKEIDKLNKIIDKQQKEFNEYKKYSENKIKK